jgi:hypothetical protein
MEKRPYHIKGFQIDIAPRWSPAKKGDLRLARLPAILLRWMDIKYVFLHRVPPFFCVAAADGTGKMDGHLLCGTPTPARCASRGEDIVGRFSLAHCEMYSSFYYYPSYSGRIADVANISFSF